MVDSGVTQNCIAGCNIIRKLHTPTVSQFISKTNVKAYLWQLWEIALPIASLGDATGTGVNPGGFGGDEPQIIGWGSCGVSVKYYHML